MCLHWYALSFVHDTRTGSAYVGQDVLAVDRASIQRAKKTAEMPTDSVLVSCSYLGQMTREFFLGE
jgi:hypothetical protein